MLFYSYNYYIINCLVFYMSHIILLIIELIGTVAFAISGAMIGLQKKMDVFGVTTLGVITAVGGGVIRDVVLGNTPPETFKNPIYGIVAILTSLIVLIPKIRKFFDTRPLFFETFILLMDSLGLSVFVVFGIQTAVRELDNFNVYLLLFVAVISGTGGSILRDVLAGNRPFIFVKHFYAMACLIGAAICIGLWKFIGSANSMLIGAVVIFVLRICAAYFHWNLPAPKE